MRNPGLSRGDYEQIFAEWLGAGRTIWLGEGCVGDDTHGHIDDIARFVARDTVVLAVEEDSSDENHARSVVVEPHRVTTQDVAANVAFPARVPAEDARALAEQVDDGGRHLDAAD